MGWPCNSVPSSDLFRRSLKEQAACLSFSQASGTIIQCLLTYKNKLSEEKLSPPAQAQLYAVFWKPLRIWDHFYYHFKNQNYLLSSENHCQTQWFFAVCCLLFLFLRSHHLSLILSEPRVFTRSTLEPF